ncbi:hypothetical protein GFB56_19510 [Ensifer sp. T173]|uniref:Uncharacterized protein n=1 Tax=Ensifer canadensis TaxID=555315 RepID=A0AAW4FNU5_9HYPH|nr:hypothetical protein [Ensifer canadensis]MBM3092971.1 hypothetical protein [Ensifer canadensis]UBI80416.1 hypothetical protein J3R84_36690 [Ensifer canadensis]
MTVIVVEKLQATGSPTTLAQLVEITGLARNVTAQTLDPLIQRGPASAMPSSVRSDINRLSKWAIALI